MTIDLSEFSFEPIFNSLGKPMICRKRFLAHEVVTVFVSNTGDCMSFRPVLDQRVNLIQVYAPGISYLAVKSVLHDELNYDESTNMYITVCHYVYKGNEHIESAAQEQRRFELRDLAKRQGYEIKL